MTGASNGLDRLREIVAILRGPDGRPWDREQTLQSMRGFLVEETYEVLEAISEGDSKALRRSLETCCSMCC